ALLKEQELAQLILSKEVEFVDLREAAQRRQELEMIEHEVRTLTAERQARFENELAEAGQIADLTQRKLAVRKIELEIETLERRTRLDLEKLEAMTRLEINQAANSNAADNIRNLASIEAAEEERRSAQRERERQSAHQQEIERNRTSQQSELELL